MQQGVQKYLSRLIEKDAIPNLLLFTGSTTERKYQLAEDFAKQLVNATKLPHPDIRSYFPEGKIGLHSIDSMRQLNREAYLPPFNSAYKVLIVQNAERMLPSSANAVLKTFEEPAATTIIILITSAPELLLPTIISRCQIVPVPKQLGETEEMTKNSPLRIAVLEAFSEGKLQSYRSLLSVTTELCRIIEEEQESLGKSIRESLEEQYIDNINSIQQQAIEKEVDGALSMHQMHQAEIIFNTVLSWYRDAHLLRVKGSIHYLLNQDYIEKIKDALDQNPLLSLEKIDQIIKKTKLSLERSAPLSSAIENLFLQLLVPRLTAQKY